MLVAGASHSTVLGNVVTGNRPTGPSFAAGGISVASTASLTGSADRTHATSVRRAALRVER
jgi:hypothetical protein